MKELIISEFLRMKERRKNKICLYLMLFNFVFSSVWYKTFGGEIGFYTPTINCKLNSLNFPAFCMKDMILILFLVVIPILAIDSFSGEYESGAYRLILIRPYSKIQLWFSKLIVQSIFSLLIFAIFFIVSSITGYILFNKVASTTFYNIPKNYDTFSAFIYNLKIALLMYLVSVAILSVAAFISSIVPKVVAAFLILLSFLMGSVYIEHGFQVLFMPFENIIKLLSLGERAAFYIPVLAYIIVFGTLSVIIFNNKDLTA